MNTSGKGLKKQHIAFLRWMFEKYGKEIRRTQFSELAFESGNNDVTVGNYIRRLQETGCISIEKIDSYKRTIRINVEYCNELLRKDSQSLLFVKH